MNFLINGKIKYFLLVLFLMFFSLSGLYSQSNLTETQKKIIAELKNDITALDLSMIQIEKYNLILLENWKSEKALRLKESEELEKKKKELEQEKSLNLQMGKQLLTLNMQLTVQDQELTLLEEDFQSLKVQIVKDQIKVGFIVGGITLGVTVLIAVPVTIYIYEKYFIK